MIFIGEKLNGSIPSIAELFANRKEEEIQKLASQQAEAGADFIDICVPMEYGEEETLHWLIDLVQNVTNVPISIDSSNVEVLKRAWKFCENPGLFNSVSMESRKEIDEIFQIMVEQPDWQVIAMLCDDEGISHSSGAEQRLRILDEIMKKAKSFGIEPSRIHIDPMAEALALTGSKDTGGSGITEYLRIVRAIRRNCPEVHITSAISNISHGLPARRYLNYSFVALAMEAGLDSAILDPLDGGLQAVIYGTETFLGRAEEQCGIEYIRAYKKGHFKLDH